MTEPVSVEALFAAVLADPDDDDARRVLADVLQQQGDPRGEFIALQFARLDGGGDPVREAELLGAHARAWSGDRAGVAFERGFLAGLELGRTGAGGLDGLVGAPEARTLRRLRLAPDLDAAATDALGRVLVDLGYLSDLGVVRIEHVEDVDVLRPRLRRVEIEVRDDGSATRIGPWIASLEQVEHVTLRPAQRRSGPLLASVVEGLAVPSVAVRDHWEGGLAALLDRVPARVERLTYGGHYHSRLDVLRGPSGRFDRAEVRNRARELQLDVVSELPASVPFRVIGPVQDVIVADWAVLPRLGAVGTHFEKVEYWGREGTAEAAAEHFEGVPDIDVLHVSLLSDQRDHRGLVELLAHRPEVAVVEITHSLRITRDAQGRLTEGELRSRWWEADERVLSVLPELHTLRRIDDSSDGRGPEDADERYDDLLARYGLAPW